MSPGHTGDTVEVKVVLGRRLTSTIMTIYMPTILLNIIGHSTNYYKPQYFDARAVVNLMVMLMILCRNASPCFNTSSCGLNFWNAQASPMHVATASYMCITRRLSRYAECLLCPKCGI